MRKSFTTLLKLVLLVLTLVGFSLLNSFGQEYKEGILQGTIRIKIKPTIISELKTDKSSKGIVITGIQAFDKLNSSYSATSMKRVFPYSPKFEERHMKHGLHLWYDITINAKASTTSAVNEYSKLQEVEIAEPIYEIKLIDGSGKPTYVSDPKSDRTTTMPLNDPYLPRQWHYNNTGQTGGTLGCDINLFNAWNITHGTPNVIVSIHDQGVQADHVDLAANMWTNLAELNGVVGVDDDNNGYIDDIHGANFATGNGTIDVGYHGTHVAGTVAGVNNNGIGISGVAGGSGVGDGARIMTCQILGGSHAADVPASYVYAADMGSVISQNSWGYSSPGVYNQSEFDAIDYFIAEAGNFPNSPMKGGVVIFASGNSNWEYLSYPGAYPPVIAVSALGSQNVRASYSNFGSWVEISAPGGASDEDARLGATSKLSNGIMSTLDKNSYGYLDGTSMACPHVSGIAALIVSKFGGANFTNNDLKTHLLTGYSDIYSIPGNSKFIDKLGVGAIDAFSGLATDGKLAPATTSNLTLSGIAQDFATLQWTVPSDPDDISAWSYQIIVSKDPITLTSIANAVVYTLAKPKGVVGDQVSFEVKDLQAITKYYFAIRSIDRWGNISDLSNIIMATTNKGPNASFDPEKPAINLTIDVTNQTYAKDSIKLINSGEGLLRWTALPRTIATVPLSIRPSLKYPTLLDPLAFPKGIKTSILSNDIEPLNAIQRDTAKEKGYVDEWSSLKMIGETNLAIPNSAATRFYVENKDGFNLTLVDQFVRYDSLTGPAILEVYKGFEISSAKLLLAQEFRKTSKSGYTAIKLNEQIYFEQGSYFWIVVHVPSGNRYPLGIGLERSSEYSKNCYMSLNVGKTWGKLEEMFQDKRVVWAVFAYEFSKRLDQFIKLNPDSGMVESNKNLYIKAEVDGSKLINGTYKSNLVAYTNETGKNSIRVPVNLTVKGHKPVIQSIKRTNFGNVIVGNSSQVTITFKNIGLGRLNYISPYVSIDNSQFVYVGGVNTIFESGTTKVLTFRFTPNHAGNIYTYGKLLDKDGNNYQFELFGAGLEAPVAVLDPTTMDYPNLTIGDTIKGQMVIKNTGKYPLDYYLPIFANGSNMETIPTDIHKFGYTTKIDSSGSTFVWKDISATGTKINDQFKGSSSSNIYWRLPLNFMFPFFGKNENAVYISKYGVLAFSIEGSAIWSMVPMHYKAAINPDRYISGCGFPMLLQDANFGNIYYKQESDKLIVQYDDCPYWDGLSYDGELPSQRITIQMILYDNGNINLYYKNVMLEKFELNSSLVAIEDQTRNDGLILNGPTWKKSGIYKRDFHWNNNSVISFISPGMGLYSNVTNPFGTILPNESKTVKYTIATDSLYLLHYTENMVVVTNDPIHNPSIFSTTFNMSNGGSSSVKADTSGFDFGSINKGVVKTNLFTLFNSGKAVDTLKTATFDNNFFTLKGNVPEVLKPERTLEYFITIKSSTVGVFTDTLRMTTKNGTIIKIGLRVEITQGPIINLLSSGGSALTSVTRFLASGNSNTTNFKISNTGSADLSVTPAGNEWAAISEVVPTNISDGYDYSWKSSRDFGGPTYEWIEIAGNGGIKTGENLSAWEGKEWTKGDKMPFTFNYYGLPYDSLFIGVNGIVSFTGRQDSVNYFFGGPTFPDKRQPDNYIAPLWVFGGPDDHTFYPLSGIYYKFETDRIIVEFRDFNTNFTMGPPISFEVILYKNGMIKFQYKMPEDGSNTVTQYGSIGIENIDGTKGITVAYYQSYVNSNMSVAFYPTRPYTIAPTQSKDFTMVLSAKELISNSYSDSIEFASNDPFNLHKKLPVKIVVSGTSAITKPDSISFGDVLIDPKVTSIVKEFEIKNPGSANFTISSANQKYAGDLNIEMYQLISNNWYWTKISNSGVFPNSVLAHQGMRFRVTLTPQTPKMLYDTLVLNTTLTTPLTAVQKIPITARVYNPPVATTSVDTIKLYAQTSTFKTTEKVILGNVTGGYKLNYALTMDYVRDTTSAAATSFSNQSKVVNALNQTSPIKLSEIQLPVSKSSTKNSTKAFNRTLAYENATSAASVLGYGGSFAFSSATGFKAPTDGFNLTHVQTWFAPGLALTSKIRVTIVGGSEDFFSCKALSTDEFTVTVPQKDLVGKLETFKLSKNVEFFPNEPFFIVFAYELACDHPQGVAEVTPVVTNRYYYGSGSDFYDLAEATSLNKYGWIVRAAEEAASYTPWVVLNAAASGSIAPTKADTLKLNFDARSAEGGDHYAKLKIQSNDVVTPTKNVVLQMRRNNGPEYQSHSSKYKVTENQILELEFSAVDYEGDSFTIALDSINPLVNLTVTDGNSITNGQFTSKVKTIKFKYSPDFNCQGTKTFGITGTDQYGNITKTSVVVAVNNVNRLPVPVSKDTLRFESYGDYQLINPYDLFADPDNDLELLEAASSNTNIIKLYSSGSNFLLMPLIKGKTSIIFKVTDQSGAIATNTVQVVVRDKQTGINTDAFTDLNLYPNPTNGVVNVKLPSDLKGKVMLNIYNSIGTLVKTENFNIESAEAFSFDMSGLPKGIYLLKWNSINFQKTNKIIKQ